MRSRDEFKGSGLAALPFSLGGDLFFPPQQGNINHKGRQANAEETQLQIHLLKKDPARKTPEANSPHTRHRPPLSIDEALPISGEAWPL